MSIKGILWHSTGANNPNLKRYIQPGDNDADKAKWLKLLGKNIVNNDWNHIDHKAGVNCWIGKTADGNVTAIQTMPWNYRPWGCGSGKKGSCNNGWIQFEICEDNLNNESYFNKVYAEACEITAYLCKMYHINPMGTVKINKTDVPTVLCHCEAAELGFGSNHADVHHWFSKYGKSMDTVRHDVAVLLGKIAETPKELYRVRKDWDDENSQIGAFYDLEKAKEACKEGYEVYDSKGTAIYPESSVENVEQEEIVISEFKKGDIVQLTENAIYASGSSIPKWLFTTKLYVRKIEKNGDITISTQKTGAITGIVKNGSVEKYTGKFAIQKK